MREFMYGTSSIAISVALFIAIFAGIEIGHRVGRAARIRSDAPPVEHVNGIRAALLGMLALLLGFTLSLSLQRFDGRSADVVDEANAIGTALLRVDFLPKELRSQAQQLFRKYVEQRIVAESLSNADQLRRAAILKSADIHLNNLWSIARKAVEQESNSVSVGLFVQALNEAIDAAGKREAALGRHIPVTVLILLFATFIMGGLVIGYSAGLGGYRAFFATYILVALMVTLVFIIFDLDRPGRGLIRVSQTSMMELRSSMDD